MFDKENTLPFPPLPNGDGLVVLAKAKTEKDTTLEEIVTQLARRERQLFGTMIRPKEDIRFFHEYLTIKPENAAFSIRELKLKKESGKDVLTGKIKVLETPCGKILREMMDKGMHLSIAPRTHLHVDSIPGSSGVKIVTWDVVPGEKK